MKYHNSLSDAVHILALIALYPDCDLTIQKTTEKRMQEITLKDILKQYHLKLKGIDVVKIG